MQDEAVSKGMAGADIEYIMPHKQVQDVCIYQHEAEPLFGHVIGRIASSHFYTHDDVTVDVLLNELNNNISVASVGVLDRKGRIQGIVTRDMFFDILGRPFGRDLYKNKQISKITLTAKTFKYTANIFSVADDLSKDLTLNKDIHYILTDDNGRYAGVFTNRDLLVYLSCITRRDMDLAKNIQSCIINDETVVKNDYSEIFAGTRMAKDVGGDYYFIKKYSTTHWFISVCDVAGKGISAALLSVLLGGMNHIFDYTRGIRQYIIKLNEFIFNSFQSEKFLTGIFADFDEATGKVQIFDAGHSYLFIQRNEKIISLESISDGLPIGISPTYNPAGYRFTLNKEDLLVMFTDGIVEQTNAEGTRYGRDAFHALLRGKLKNENLKIIKDSVFHDIRKFRNFQAQDDDMTILLLRYLA